MDGKEWLVMADGRTGAVKRQVEWPTPPMPHVYNNFRTAIAKFHQGYADDLVVLTDSGGVISVTAYDKELKMLWQHTESRKKDYFGHYVYPVDVNGDGIDEVFVSHLCLDSKGNTVWNNYQDFDDNHDHMDAMEFFDLNGDGKPELVTGQSDVGALAYNAQNGQIIWQNLADHTQQITAGYILKNSTTPQVGPTAVLTARAEEAAWPPNSTGSTTKAICSRSGRATRLRAIPTLFAATGTATAAGNFSGTSSGLRTTAAPLCFSKSPFIICSIFSATEPSR